MPLEPIRRGAAFSRQYTLADEDGNPRNLAGSTFTWKIRGDNFAMITFSGSKLVVDAPSGTVDVVLTAADTATIPANNGAESYLEETIAGVADPKAHLLERVIPVEAID